MYIIHGWKGNTSGGIHCEHFFHYFVIRKNATVFEAELFAINEALKPLLSRPGLNNIFFIFVDSKPALEATANNETPKSNIIESIWQTRAYHVARATKEKIWRQRYIM